MPKTASTSLMHTLSKLHKCDCDMHFTWDGKISPLYREYSRQHSFCWDLDESSANDIVSLAQNKIIKSHILPTTQNVRLLAATKKVFLRKHPEKIIESYFRGHFTGVYPIKIPELKKHSTLESWLDYANESGLLSELWRFYHGWQAGPNCLICDTDDLLKNPTQTVNLIEDFFQLENSEVVELDEEKYTRSFVKRFYMSLRLFFHKNHVTIERRP